MSDVEIIKSASEEDVKHFEQENHLFAEIIKHVQNSK